MLHSEGSARLTRLGGRNAQLHGAGRRALVVLEGGSVGAGKLAEAVDGARVHAGLTAGDVHLLDSPRQREPALFTVLAVCLTVCVSSA